MNEEVKMCPTCKQAMECAASWNYGIDKIFWCPYCGTLDDIAPKLATDAYPFVREPRLS
jgi:hypothetical protein